MSSAHVFIPQNRLRSILGDAGDATVSVLAERAERSLDPLRAKAKDYVVARLQTIERLVDQPEEILFADSGALEAAALEICEIAATARMEMVGEAARALYKMVSALRLGVWHDDALKLHVQTLTLIAAHDLPTVEVQTLLTRLKTVRERIGAPD